MLGEFQSVCNGVWFLAIWYTRVTRYFLSRVSALGGFWPSGSSVLFVIFLGVGVGVRVDVW